MIFERTKITIEYEEEKMRTVVLLKIMLIMDNDVIEREKELIYENNNPEYIIDDITRRTKVIFNNLSQINKTLEV